MKIIPISGIIGSEVRAAAIRSQLEAARGEPVEAQVSSPGGIVFEAIEVFNLIKNYAGSKTIRLMGLAASAASYIAMAGDRVIAEDNAVFMIHNAAGVAIGDYRTMRKVGEILDSFSALLARAYAAKSGKGLAEVRRLMDDETFYFGREAQAAGFVDEVIPASGGEKDRASALARARLGVASASRFQREQETADAGWIEKAAAMLGSFRAAAPAPRVDTSPEAVMDFFRAQRDPARRPLTAEEKRLCELMNITEAAYREQLVKEEVEKKAGRR